MILDGRLHEEQPLAGTVGVTLYPSVLGRVGTLSVDNLSSFSSAK